MNDLQGINSVMILQIRFDIFKEYLIQQITSIQNTDLEIEILRLLPVVPWQIKYL